MTTSDFADIRPFVREHYGKLAEESREGLQTPCCGESVDTSCCASETSDVIQLYEDAANFDLPAEIANFSLGCGDPITLAALQPGQTVLDLGSGGGLDCFLAARKVGPSGHVIGVDMTSAMLDRARSNQTKLGLENVEFRLGEIEHLPVGDASVDVIISNCVINLSPDKPQVFKEAYRVLKSGGKLAVSDIVTSGPLPDEIKNSLSAWAGCVAGALDVEDYLAAIRAAGFINVSLTPVYLSAEAIDKGLEELEITVDREVAEADDIYKTIFSAKITAWKP